MQDRRTWQLSGALGLILVLMAGVTGIAVTGTVRANEAIESTRREVLRLSQTEDAIAAEAFAEAAYRRAPSAAARARLDASVREVEDQLTSLRDQLGADDPLIFSRIRQLNRRYVAEVEATLDDPASSLTDDRVAGPALDAMSRLLGAAIASRRAEVDAQILRQQEVVRLLIVALVTTYTVSFAAIGFLWRGLLRERRMLRDVADTDPLTGLRNRRAMEKAMARTLARPHSRAALVLVDLDRFKPVNDEHGHQLGDLVLVEVGRRLQEVARAGDVAARLGGDEFALFLPRGQGAEHFAQRVCDEMNRPYEQEGLHLGVGASVGWASAPEDADDVVGLVRAADVALYEAKAAGRGRVAAAGRPGTRTRSPRDPTSRVGGLQ